MSIDDLYRIEERGVARLTFFFVRKNSRDTAGQLEYAANVLRELARRVRENGMFANERLARFVRVANQCADIARSMQQSVERRDEQPPPEPKDADAGAEHKLELTEVDDAPELGAVEQQIEEKVKSIGSRAEP